MISGSESLSKEATLEGRSALRRYGFAVGAVSVALLLRLALDPLLHEKLPFAAFLIAVILTIWFAGVGPALLTLGAGFFLANWFFLGPRHEIALTDPAHVLNSFSYALVGLAVIFFGRAMHLARQRADANAREAIGHQKRLEQEVAERTRAEEEVRRLNAELEKRVEQRTEELVIANRELESFTYSVSHDLRAPLRHMDGYAQILEEEFGTALSEEGRGYTEKIRRASQNMGRLVDDLLNLSQVGKRELARQRVELDGMITEIVHDLKPETAARRINWQIGRLPAVECDPGLMKLAFVNLLSNAVKYTRTRTDARIEVGLLKDNGERAIFVRDNGVGFNMKYAGKLFGVFQRLHRSEEFEGTGVGLATVARIVHKHGGRVWAEAELGKGATFFLTLGETNGNGSAVAEDLTVAPLGGA